MSSLKTLKSKKGQVTIFIIIAIIIIAAVLLFLFLSGTFTKGLFPEAKEAQQKFLGCVELKTRNALSIAGMQAGYLELPSFEAGSSYMPFSNYFNFIGSKVPYWFYVSGNGIANKQMPSQSEIEKQISEWLEEEISDCIPNIESTDMIFEGNPSVTTSITDNSVNLEIYFPLKVTKGESTSIIEKHSTSVKTKFGSLYSDAKKIFDSENTELFLEEYSIDFLNLYVPTTKFELSCAPKIWQVSEVENNLKDALSANVPMIKFKGSYYSLSKPENKYFVTEPSVKNQVNLIYSKDWPTKIDVWPSEEGVLQAIPIGNQPELSILGLCYLTYHFVYDVTYPILIQISNDQEIFQFPVLVVIDKNTAREAESEESVISSFDICNNKAQTATVLTYDQDANPLETRIYFKCFNQECYIGKTIEDSGKEKLTAKFPECVNGVLIAKKEGYEDSRTIISSNQPFIQNIFLDKTYPLEVDLNLAINEKAIVTFVSENKKISLYHPEQKTIELAPKTYNITVQLTKESTLNLESQTGEKCVNIPGGLGLPFLEKEECFELNIPEQTFTEVIFGGGNSIRTFESQELKSKNILKITPEKFDVPSSIEELAEIYELLEVSELKIQLK